MEKRNQSKPLKGTIHLGEQLLKSVRFAATEMNDMPFYYRAYLLGSFANVNPNMNPDNGQMSFAEFVQEFSDVVALNSILSVTYYRTDDETNEEVPVGVGMFWIRACTFEMGHTAWFPWASVKDIYLSTLNFMNVIRHMKHPDFGQNYQVVEFARIKDEPFFDKFVERGIMQKVGKLYDCHPDEEYAIVYATVKPDKDKQ